MTAMQRAKRLPRAVISSLLVLLSALAGHHDEPLLAPPPTMGPPAPPAHLPDAPDQALVQDPPDPQQSGSGNNVFVYPGTAHVVATAHAPTVEIGVAA